MTPAVNVAHLPKWTSVTVGVEGTEGREKAQSKSKYLGSGQRDQMREHETQQRVKEAGHRKPSEEVPTT